MLIYDAFKKSDPKKYTPHQIILGSCGSASGTPVSDGRFVYVWYVTGVIACYDLDGQRQWISDIGREKTLGGHHHGSHSSPAISSEALLVVAGPADGGTLFAFDKKTGAPLWNQPLGGKTSSLDDGSVLTARIGNDEVAILSDGRAFRTSDGKPAWPAFPRYCGHSITPVIVDRLFCNYETTGVFAARLPEHLAADTRLTSERPSTLPVQSLWSQGTYYSASPLLTGGLVYAVTSGWVSGNVSTLRVLELKETPALLYQKVLDIEAYSSFSSWPGVAASPALAGQNVYIVGNTGVTLVLQPGREFKQLARNRIVNLPDNTSPEQFISCPVFHGKRLYLRGSDYLYCIEEENGK
jgi:outer membrane protein assembly factor BamB